MKNLKASLYQSAHKAALTLLTGKQALCLDLSIFDKEKRIPPPSKSCTALACESKGVVKSFKSDRVEEQNQDDDHVGAGGGHGVHGEQHQQWLWFPAERAW